MTIPYVEELARTLAGAVDGTTTLTLACPVTLAGAVTTSAAPLTTGQAFTAAYAGTAARSAITIGAVSTEGLIFKAIDETLDLTTLGGKTKNLTATIPVGAVILSVQTNVEALVVAGGTSVQLGIGSGNATATNTYGVSTTLTKNTKTNYLAATYGAVAATPEQISVNAVVTGAGASLGNTNISAGSVRVRVVYLVVASLADAA
jgi:hypothetical protein